MWGYLLVLVQPVGRDLLAGQISHIQANYLKQTAVKNPGRAETNRFWNYPYAAIEEAVVDNDFNESGTKMISFTGK